MHAAQSQLRKWRERPVSFVQECLGATPDRWQEDVLEAFPLHQRIAMKACKGPGKSTVEAWLIWNFLATRPHPKIACTSITGDNLRDGLWTELAKWMGRSELLRQQFVWTGTRVMSREHPETWWASARSWSKSADLNQQADTLAGLHAEHILFVLDEAGGIPDSVAAAAEAALAVGKETKLVIAGNPVMLDGPLYRACTKERALWWLREVTGDPDAPDRASRISVSWAREQIEKYGRDSAWVLVNVFGQFPPVQSNALLGVPDVELAQRLIVEDSVWSREARVLGVDVARYGDDRSVFFPRQGRVAMKPRTFRDLDLMTLAGQLANAIDKWKPEATFIDETGIGSGLVDRMHQLGFPVIGVEFGGKPLSGRFVNRRAEMWWLMAEWVKHGGCLPAAGQEAKDLVSELTAPTYSFDSSGRTKLESKQDLKDRGHPSPDIADALALTFAAPVAPPMGDSTDWRARGIGRGRAAIEYDPFALPEKPAPVVREEVL